MTNNVKGAMIYANRGPYQVTVELWTGFDGGDEMHIEFERHEGEPGPLDGDDIAVAIHKDQLFRVVIKDPAKILADLRELASKQEAVA